jgi:hypothetical protein
MRAPAFEEIEQQAFQGIPKLPGSCLGPLAPGGHARILWWVRGGRLNRFPKVEGLFIARTRPRWREQDSNMKQ